MSSRHSFIFPCVAKQLGTNCRQKGSSLTVSLHMSCVFKWSGTYLSAHEMLRTTLLHILWVLKWSGTYCNKYGRRRTASLCMSYILRSSGINLSVDGSLHTASLHISCVLKWSRTNSIWPNKISWDIILNNNSIILFYNFGPRQGLNFMVLPHFQIHCHDLSCSMYAQQLMQALNNYQMYTQKTA